MGDVKGLRDKGAAWVYGALPISPLEGPPLPYSLDFRWEWPRGFLEWLETDPIDTVKYGLSNLIAGESFDSKDKDWVKRVPHRKFYKKEWRMGLFRKIREQRVDESLEEFTRGEEEE